MWKGFQKPKRLASELESLTEKYGRFSAQPFERGWGTTVGNALRRALLSSIEGAAITAVKIEGVLHEFSSIPGVVEDATDIILNLKQVPIKLNTDLPKTIYVNVEQAGPVTSAQIEEDADFAVLDKSVYIATVSEGGKLQIEMRTKNGRMIVRRNRIALGEIGDSRISRRGENFRLLRKLPRECVLSSAPSDNEKSDLYLPASAWVFSR